MMHKDNISEASQSAKTSSALLVVSNIQVVYASVILALKGVSLEVHQGKIAALLGANGAGKSTTLKAISKLIDVERGAITKGFIKFQGKDIASAHAHDLVRSGVVQVLEGRHVFPHLTVEDNLLVPGYVKKMSRGEISANIDKMYEYFPRLKIRRKSQAGFASGGEQQMIAIGRALMLKPTLILLDEPSMGLAPQIVEEIFEIIKNLNEKEGVSFLLAEQNTTVALRYADFAYILETGRVVMHGSATDLAASDDVKELYLGISNKGGRKSFRDAKHYNRRQRLFS